MNLQIFCRCFSLVRYFLVFDNLPLIEAAQAGSLDSRNMDKHISSAAAEANFTEESEPVALSGVYGLKRDAAIRLVRALVARGVGQSDSMANVAIRNIAAEAGLDDQFDAALEYAMQQRWLVSPTIGWATLTAAGYAAATA